MKKTQMLDMIEYALSLAETIEDIKLIKEASAAMAKLAKKENFTLELQNKIGVLRIEVLECMGMFVRDIYLKRSRIDHQETRYKLFNNIHCEGKISRIEFSNSWLILNEPELKEVIIAEIIGSGDVVTPSKILNGIKRKIKGIKTIFHT